MIAYTVSIAVHDNLQLTRVCLEVLFTHRPPGTEIIVINNGSDAETATYLEALAQEGLIGVLDSLVNLGFNKAHNWALENAHGVYFVVLNNDVVVSPGTLEAMRTEFLRNPKLGVCGVKVTCGSLRPDGIGFGGEAREYVEGSCLMIPTWLARRELLFDPVYRFAYCEDADLSLRLRRKGYDITCVDIPLEHQRGSTSAIVRKTIDLSGYHAYNHEVFKARWSGYLQTRSFERTVLLKRRGAIGDVLLTTPVIHALKLQNAHTRVVVETACPSVFERNMEVEFAGLMTPVTIDEAFDLNLAYEKAPQKPILDVFAETCGVKLTDRRPRIFPGEKDRQFARLVHERARGSRVAVIHPGSTKWPGRNWLVDRWDEVTKELRHRGWYVVLVGDGATPMVACNRDLRGCTDLHKLAAVIERANLFVGIDSLPMHLAQAAMIPLVGVFGMIDPRMRLDGVLFFRGVTASLSEVGCLGCHHVQLPPRTTGRCFRDREYCMERLSVHAVLEAINQVLEAYQMQLETSKIRHKVLMYCKGVGIDIGCGRDKITTEAIGFDDDPLPGVDRVGNAAAPMPFGDEEFPFVYSSHCLEDIADTEGTLREWTRILRPGGYLILHVPHPEHYKGYNMEHKHAGFTPMELNSMLTVFGLKVWEAYMDLGPDRYSTVVVGQKAPFDAWR